jgi:hypothetical protein
MCTLGWCVLVSVFSWHGASVCTGSAGGLRLEGPDVGAVQQKATPPTPRWQTARSAPAAAEASCCVCGRVPGVCAIYFVMAQQHVLCMRLVHNTPQRVRGSVGVYSLYLAVWRNQMVPGDGVVCLPAFPSTSIPHFVVCARGLCSFCAAPDGSSPSVHGSCLLLCSWVRCQSGLSPSCCLSLRIMVLTPLLCQLDCLLAMLALFAHEAVYTLRHELGLQFR